MITYYAGLDVSLRSVAICIIDDQGTVYPERTVPSEVTDIVACLGGFDHAIEVVGFEAGTLSPVHTVVLKLSIWSRSKGGQGIEKLFKPYAYRSKNSSGLRLVANMTIFISRCARQPALC